VRAKAPAAKIDPKYLASARELRDRALEHFNGDPANDPLLLRAAGKYDVSRSIAQGKAMPLLKAG